VLTQTSFALFPTPFSYLSHFQPDSRLMTGFYGIKGTKLLTNEKNTSKIK